MDRDRVFGLVKNPQPQPVAEAGNSACRPWAGRGLRAASEG